MSSLIFHSRASTLCRATEASETCRCVASPTGGGAPAHTHTHTCTHVPCRHAPTLYIVYSNNMLCVLSSDCPATAAAPAAATQNQPPAAANPGEAVSCVCVCVSIHVLMICVCVYVCDFMHLSLCVQGPTKAIFDDCDCCRFSLLSHQHLEAESALLYKSPSSPITHTPTHTQHMQSHKSGQSWRNQKQRAGW